MRFLNKLFDSFNEENLKYCILRNYEKLPYNIGNDLDLLLECTFECVKYDEI